MPHNDYNWYGAYAQVLVMIIFLGSMWIKKSCSGVSLRTQVLFALVFTTRQQDLNDYRIPIENIVFKVLSIAVSYAMVLSILGYFQKTYEKQHDKTSIKIWLIVCLVLGMILNDRFDILEVFTAFSLFLEAVAMIPQFQFILKTKRIDKHIMIYIGAMALYTLCYFGYWWYQYFYSWGPRYSFQMAAAAIQLLLYCDFFYQVYPLLFSCNFDSQRRCCGFFRKFYNLLCTDESEDSDETGDVEEGHLANNVSNVVLSPFSLTGFHNEKEILTAGDLGTKGNP